MPFVLGFVKQGLAERMEAQVYDYLLMFYAKNVCRTVGILNINEIIAHEYHCVIMQ